MSAADGSGSKGSHQTARRMVTKAELRACLRDPVGLLALGFGTGLAPRAPGTAGTLVGIPLYLLLVNFHWSVYVLATIACFIAGIWICGEVSARLGQHDHSSIVWDEVVGFLVTMFLVPQSLLALLLGFLLFRLFDIWKPWPIGWADSKVHGGMGIMLDDLLAGFFACACTHIVLNALVPFLVSLFT